MSKFSITEFYFCFSIRVVPNWYYLEEAPLRWCQFGTTSHSSQNHEEDKITEQAITMNKELANKIEKLQHSFGKRLDGHAKNIETLFEAIRQLMNPPNPPRKKIGFRNWRGKKYLIPFSI